MVLPPKKGKALPRSSLLCMVACAAFGLVFFTNWNELNINALLAAADTNAILASNPEQQQDTSASAVPSATSMDSCLASAYLYLCLPTHQKKQVHPECYADPVAFFKNSYKGYTPTFKEAAAKKVLQTNNVRHVSIGCGSASGFLCDQVVKGKTLCTDRPDLDLFETNSWQSLISVAEDGLEVIFASHVLEHFEPVQISKIAAAAFLALKPGGVFRVNVPDGYKPATSYQRYIRVGGTPSGSGQNHMVAWTIDNMPPLFESVGFEIVQREHFDVTGKFFTAPDAYEKDQEYGMVTRSFKHDYRNVKPYKDFKNPTGIILANELKEGEPMYTSLWFDAVKPAACRDIWRS